MTAGLKQWLLAHFRLKVGDIDHMGWFKVLRAAFVHPDPKSTKDTDDLTVFLRFWN